MNVSQFEELERAVEQCCRGIDAYLAASNSLVLLEQEARAEKKQAVADLLRALHVNVEKLCRLEDSEGREYYRLTCCRLLKELRKAIARG